MRRFLIPLLFVPGAVGLAAPAAEPCPTPTAYRTAELLRLAKEQRADWAPVLFQKVDPPAKADPAPKKKFGRGLKPTPRWKIAATKQFDPRGVRLPTSVAYVPTKLSMWLNDSQGDCVTAEEAFNQDVMGTFIADTTVQAWAGKYGFLDGANLTDVMDQMKLSGFSQGGSTYGVGSYSSVNFTDEPSLQAAISLGVVKYGLDANALPSGAGNANGWYAYGGNPGQFGNEDHCMGFCGFGSPQAMFTALGMAVPADWPAASKTAYLVFTWSTIGVVDHAWVMSTVGEAYVRQPDATINGAPQPNPGPNPPNPPNPPPPPPSGGTTIIFNGGLTPGSTGTYTVPADGGVYITSDMTLAQIVARFNEAVKAKPVPLKP